MSLRIIDCRPPKIAQFFILTAVFLHWVTPMSQLHLYANLVLGSIVGIAGFAIMMGGWWLFKKFDTAISPTAKSDHLVTTGIYQYTRNPMYLGITGMLLGIAIVFGTVPFYGATVAYFVVINNVFCRYEENQLSKTFGAPYIAYKNNVRRWF